MELEAQAEELIVRVANSYSTNEGDMLFSLVKIKQRDETELSNKTEQDFDLESRLIGKFELVTKRPRAIKAKHLQRLF